RKLDVTGVIEIRVPETWPEEVFVTARYAWAPAIAAAKAWALTNGEWDEAMPPVDVGAGKFGDEPPPPGGGYPPGAGPEESLLRTLLTPGLGRPRSNPSAPHPTQGESLLSYFLVPGRSARLRRKPGS